MKASYDIMGASLQGYRLVWAERHYLFRLAAVPVLVKFICYLLLTFLDWQNNFLRQAIVMLPSNFTDGWMLAHLVRLIYLEQRWPFRPTGEDKADMIMLGDRARGVLGGTLVFVVIEYALAGITQFVYYSGLSERAQEEGPSSAIAIAMMLLFALSIWAFRFLWVYVPAAINKSIPEFNARLGGFSTSFHLIGTWLMCFLPVFLVFRVMIMVLVAPYAGGEEVIELPFSAEFFVGFLVVLMDTITGLLATAGIAFGLKAFLPSTES